LLGYIISYPKDNEDEKQEIVSQKDVEVNITSATSFKNYIDNLK
jgi:hypothetical protein